MKIKLSAFLQWRFNMFVYKICGWRWTFSYISLLCWFYFLFKKRERDGISISVQSLFSDNPDTGKHKEMIRGVFNGIIAHYYEKIFNAYEGLPGLQSFFNECINADGLNKLDHALMKGRGVLFVTAHYGGIEFIPFFLTLKGYPVSAIGKFSSKRLKEKIYSRANDIGMRLIDADQKHQTIKTVIRELRANRIVFTECDEIEEWKPSHMQRMTFLNKIIGVDRTINIILKRTGAEVIFGLLHRIRLNQYDFIMESVQDIMVRLGKNSVSIGEALLKSLEHYILADPEGWYQWKNYSKLGMDFEAVKPSEVMPSITPLRPVME